MDTKALRQALWAVMAASVVTCVGKNLWERSTDDLPGEVASTQWQRAVVRERFTPVTKKDWKDKLRTGAPVMPVNGTGEKGGVQDVRDCERRQRGTRQVRTGSKRVCKDGFKDCRDVPEYRTEFYYGDECTYETYVWTEVERARAAGTDVPPRWPDNPAVGELERLRREETYAVSIRYEDDGVKEHVIPSGSEQDFLTWAKGQRVTLTVTNTGKVENLVRR